MAIRILSSENITGNLTLSGNQTTGGDLYVTGTSNSLVVISRDNMYVDAGQLYIGADDAATDDTFRQRVTSGSYFIESRKSGTWTNRLQINTAGTLIVQQGMAISGNIDGVGASFIGTAASGAALVTIENNSGSTATSYGLLVKGGGNSASGKTFEVRDDSGNTDLIVKGNGNVGIGTTSPIQKLDTPNIVIGGSTIAGAYRANALFMDNNGGNSRFYSSGPNDSTQGSYEFNIMASDANPLQTPLVINSSGNLGIGTTSPTARLDILTNSVTGDNNIDRYVRFRADNGEQRFVFNIGRSGNNSALLMYDSSEVQTVNIGSGGTSYFNGGSVGIGVTFATAKLQIHNTNAGAAAVAAYLVNASTSLNTETRLAFAAHTNDDIATGRYSYISTVNTSGSNGQAMTFATNETGASAVERMRIKSNGQVNISQKPNSGLEYDLLINLGTSPDGLVGYQTREQFNNATLQKWYNVDAANSGSSQWVRLGTLSNFAQGGHTFCLTFYGHTGYNASNSQDFNCKLFMKTSNGAGTGPRFNSWVENTGKNLASPAFKWINTNASGTPTVGGTSFELYMNVPPYCNGSIYAINKHSGDWTSQNAIGQSDPGADSTTVLQAQNVFNILNTNVGIGTVSPSQKLEVTGNTYVTGYVQASSALIGYKSGYATFGSNSTATGIALSRDFLPSSYPDLIINSSGSVGIGVSAESTSRLHVKYISGNNNCKMTLESNNSGDSFINYSAASNEMSAGFDTSAAQFIIAGGDNLSVPKFALTQSTGDTTIAGTLTQNSDITLKENIKPLESQLEIVSKLNPVSYNKIGFEDNEVGFIAQEVEKLLPELVREDKDGLKSLAYGNMNAILVKAIQELKAEIELLKNK